MARGQLKLFQQDKTSFGGSLFSGNAREKRPFSPKSFTHVVLRSTHAKGEWSMLHRDNKKVIESKIRYWAKEFNVTIKRFVNVGNHLHLLIQARREKDQSDFFRTVTALICRHITGSKRGTPSRVKKFWDAKPFTKLVKWAVQYPRVLKYLSYNSLEAIGFSKQGAKEYLGLFSTA